MEYFVNPESIVRQVWGKADTVLFIFAGAAAEFALNRQVHWLYVTGKLPADPIGRLFSTVTYARKIIFTDLDTALAAIDQMNHIHAAVEKKRAAHIPNNAYKDVLYMLIHYSIASFELLERPLTAEEKEELVNIFVRVGRRMNIQSLPANFADWQEERNVHLQYNLVSSVYTKDLYTQYKKHLGNWRYQILIQVQQLIAPPLVVDLLQLKKFERFPAFLNAYRISKRYHLNEYVKWLLFPGRYRQQIKDLDQY